MNVTRGVRVVAALWLAGCAGFPDKPGHPTLPVTVPLADTDRPSGGQWPQPQWWHRYQDATLDGLIDRGLESAPSLQTAVARFDAARESVSLVGAASGARVGLAGDLTRQRLSDNGLFPPVLLGFHWYNQSDLGLQVSYTFDWWGKQRSAVEAALDEAHAAAADRSAATLALASGIADTYFGWQADQQRLVLAQQRLDVALTLGVVAADRLQAELDTREAVHRADSAIAAAREQIAILEGSARLRIVELAALVGCSSSELPPLESRPLPAVTATLPDNVRLDLVSRRADITASRWRVESALQALDSARAEFYPDISINALAGLSALDVGKLLQYGSRVPQAGLALHLPVFDSGRLKAAYRGRDAQLRAAVAGYRQTLIDAARDVATQLVTLQQIDEQRRQRLVELRAADDLRDGAVFKVRQGLTDIRPQLTATQTQIEQRDAVLLIDALALSAEIGLQRALGGGYESDASLVNSTR